MKQLKKFVAFVLTIFVVLSSSWVVLAENEIGIEFDNDMNNLGYIYFDYNPVIYASIINSSSEKKSTAISAEIYHERESIWSKTYQITIPKDSSEVLSVNTEISQFGIFTLKLTVNGFCTEKEISIANRPRDGVKNSRFALSDHTASMGHGVDEAERKAELFSKAGFSGLRYSYVWYNLELPENVFNLPACYTTIKNVLKKQNMDIFNCLDGSSRYVDEDFPTTDGNLNKWVNYVKYVMSKSDDTTSYYEVRNESNIKADVTPGKYFNLLKKTYQTIHSVNDSAKVCAFAAANVGNGEGTGYSALAWMEEVLKLMRADGGKYMDAVSIHTYNSVNPEAPNTQLLSGRTWLIDETRQLLDRYGLSDIPIIVSEMGWYNSGAVSELNQAQYMVRYAALNYEKTERIYWYVSQEKQTGNDKEDTFGIIKTWDNATGETNPYGAKPAFLALSNFNAFMADAELLEKCGEAENIYNYKFRDRFGKDVHLAWSTKTENAEITIDGSGKYLTVYDMYGNIVKSVETAGSEKITVNASPVYIRLTDEAEEPSKNKISVSVDANSGMATVNGISPYGNRMAGISVVKNNGQELRTDEIVYINQIQTDSDGDYSFHFMTDGENGIYNVKIGFYDSNFAQTAQFEMDICVPKLYAELNGKKLSSISNLHENDAIDIGLSNISNVTSDRETALLVAEYKNGALSAVKSFGIDNTTEKYSQKYVVGNVETIDKIKIYYWDINSLCPITEFYEIK